MGRSIVPQGDVVSVDVPHVASGCCASPEALGIVGGSFVSTVDVRPRVDESLEGLVTEQAASFGEPKRVFGPLK